MSAYGYECEVGHIGCVDQRITDEPLTECPVRTITRRGGDFGPPCGKPCKRLIGKGTSFILEGGGWEKDGYS